MFITHKLKYFEPFLPPRCRKHRSRQAEAEFTVEVPELTGEQAPVAIVQHNNAGRDCLEHGDVRHKRIEYRWHNEKLYVRCRLRRFMCLNNGQRNRWATIKDVHVESYRVHDNREMAEAHLCERHKDYVLIDGDLHEEIGEPRYVICTFGLGHNHGLGWGTCLSTDNYYNSNISKDRYYRIDQEEEARSDGRAIAARRGDTKAFPHFARRMYERFTILIPEAVRLDPQHEHGDGDPFINRANEITESGVNPMIAGLALMAEAFRS